MAGSVKFGELLVQLGALIFKGTVLRGITSKNICYHVALFYIILNKNGFYL
jgi:hypothetical protein